MIRAPITFHVAGSILRDRWRLGQFYGPLADGLRARGGDVRLVMHERDKVADQIAADDGFHVIDHGQTRDPRVLNSGIAYILPFRNMDPWGIRAFSSIADKHFDPARIPAPAAASFAARLQERLIGGRTSRYIQPADVMAVPAGCIAVFLQTESHRLVGETCYLSMRRMVTALMARDDPRPICIKPHPRDFDSDTHEWLYAQAQADPRVQIVAGNIHDILAACSVVVTINSAVGVEAMLHAKPVVLCGHTDFHHCAVTVKTVDEMDAGVAQAMAQIWPYEAFLYWYFVRHCLSPLRKTLVQDFLGKVTSAGFNVARFRLDPPPKG